MRILHLVESYLPVRHGMSEVVSRLSEGLAGKGHLITVATSRDPARCDEQIRGVRIVAFGISGNCALGYREQQRGELDRYCGFLETSQFHIVGLFAAQQWSVDLALARLGQISGKKVFVPTGFSQLRNPRYRAYYTAMRDWLKQVDASVFLSEGYQDVEFARRSGISNGVLIPNGASAAEFVCGRQPDFRRRIGIRPEHLLILHVGGLTGVKGHRECLDIFDRAGLRDATLFCVAEDFNKPAGSWSRRLGRRLSCRLLRKSYDASAERHAALRRRAARIRNRDGRKQVMFSPLTREDTAR